VRCHIHAFTALGGVAREIFYDNLATAVVCLADKLHGFADVKTGETAGVLNRG
jgi:transposase